KFGALCGAVQIHRFVRLGAQIELTQNGAKAREIVEGVKPEQKGAGVELRVGQQVGVKPVDLFGAAFVKTAVGFQPEIDVVGMGIKIMHSMGEATKGGALGATWIGSGRQFANARLLCVDISQALGNLIVVEMIMRIGA